MKEVGQAFPLSPSNQRKDRVQDGAGSQARTLETLIGERLREFLVE
ncbi:MAG: hypothetical protein GX575_27440 [Candidatus Anammoximicrobium sp.]|nr:hypothetical protein [Candidatus Anammoximicrobium sp.]